jgi:hypothetical protein
LQSPFTSSPHEAYLVAESSVATVLTAVVWWQKPPRVLFALLVVSIWGVALGSAIGEPMLGWSSTLATVAILLSAPWTIGLVAVVVRLLLAQADAFFTDSDLELAVLHTAAIGLLLGLRCLPAHSPGSSTDDPVADRSDRNDDLAIFATSMALAAVVSFFVLRRSCDSADEWSYTFQAAVFAKGRAYAELPPCAPAFQNFWVFWKDNRVFSQYPPGWPLFASPFQAFAAMWLAAPVAHGLLAAGVARLARRAVARPRAVAVPGETRLAGFLAAATVTVGSTMLINGASRYSHTFLCALFAWCVEAACVVTSPLTGHRRQLAWGALLGGTAAWMLGTRPADACFLGFGIFTYFVYALARSRVRWRSVAAAVAAFASVGGIVLVILRLQLGAWFKTGYSLTPAIQPWAQVAFSWPKPSEYKWPFPLATGSYCWWPCAPALGVAGFAAMSRSGAGRIAYMLSIGVIGVLGLYTSIALGRGWDFGYGPRYQMPVVVPMAVGGAALLAPLFGAARRMHRERAAFYRSGPATLALFAFVAGVVVIATQVYPYNYAQVRLRNVVFEAIEREGIHNAVVTISQGSTISDQLDLTQNLPLDLYPDQDVLVVSDPSPEMHACVKDLFPGRRFYRTVGSPDVTLHAD